MSEIRGLTIKQPWCYAISHLGKRIENRTWAPTYRGLLALHASASVGSRADFNRQVLVAADLGDASLELVRRGSLLRGAVFAVASLNDVCAASLRSGRSGPLRCSCGKWAATQHCHLRLTQLRLLPVPVPAKGALSLWRLPADVDAAVRAQIAEEHAA